jgi:hypothetical protein
MKKLLKGLGGEKIKRKNKALKNAILFFSLTAIFFCFFATSTAKAFILFEDDFDGSQAIIWQPIPAGAPDMNYITLNGNTVLRMTSIMEDWEGRGIYNLNTFNFSEGQIIVDLRTMPFSDPEVNATNQKNIDGLLTFLLYSDTAPMMGFTVKGYEFGTKRVVEIFRGDNFCLQSASGIWDYENDYRFVITSELESTVVSFKDAAGNDLFTHTFDFNLGTLGDFNIQMIQDMGTPQGEYYSDVALDYLEVSEPTHLAILDFFDASVADSSIVGIGNGSSGNGRLNALKNMLKMAGDLINIGDIEGACDQLKAAQKKCDGDSSPPDFVSGDAVTELNYMITELMIELGCE